VNSIGNDDTKRRVSTDRVCDEDIVLAEGKGSMMTYRQRIGHVGKFAKCRDLGLPVSFNTDIALARWEAFECDIKVKPLRDTESNQQSFSLK
jgi:hypothetical protein